MSGTDNKKRREQELSATVQANREPLLAYIRKQTRDALEAEDVFQDVVQEYVEAYDLGEAIEAVGNWLLRVARNKVIDRFRRKKTQNDYVTAEMRDEDAILERGGPEDESINNVLREEILDALELLPGEQRDVFIRHELEGQSFEEISAATGVGVNTLLSRKRYAVLFLREHLKEIYDELDE